jgi:anaerobic selenocysteine-containing dehydrogenase
MIADVEDGRLVRLRPDKEHPMSAGFACQKGIAVNEVVNDPDRVTHPLRREPDGTFSAICWDKAVDDIAKRLSAIHRQHGPGAIGWRVANGVGGVNVNELTSSDPDDVEALSGMAWLTGFPIEVERSQ